MIWKQVKTFIVDTVSGGSHDWIFEKGYTRYSFTPELRGPYFTTDPENIELSGQELFNGLVAMVEEIRIIEGL